MSFLDKAKDMAEDIADKADDMVDKVGDKIGDQSVKTGLAIDDAEITARVKAAIFAEPGLKTLHISVDTVKGVVTLSGSVDSLADNDKAKALAAAVSGVNEVQNQLVITMPK